MSIQFSLTALVDSSCTGSFIDIDINVVLHFKIPTKKLKVPTPVYNADGTLNQLGGITDYIKVTQETLMTLNFLKVIRNSSLKLLFSIFKLS